MSSIVINGDTSGSITLSAPAVSGTSVITLPASSTYTMFAPMADQWRLGTAATASSGDLTTGWARPTETVAGTVGTGMTQSSGVFTFPTTGVYQINLQARLQFSTATQYGYVSLNISNDSGSSYTNYSDPIGSVSTNNYYTSVFGTYIINVASASTIRVKVAYGGTASFTVQANSSINLTALTFVRLG